MGKMICTRCRKTKSEPEFPPSRGQGKLRRPRQCVLCRKEADRAKSLAYKERYPDRRRGSYRAYDVKRNEERRRRWREDPEYRLANREASAKYRQRAKEQLSIRNRERYRRRKEELLRRYGGQCECCGETRIEFLVIDHIAGNGSEERKRLGPTGVYQRLYKAPKRLPGYRLLCHNCNSALAYYGYCPHIIADPDGAGMLDVVGFDTATPTVLADFATAAGAATGS